MKHFLIILALTVSLASTLSADEDIRGLGMVNVTEVIYMQDGEFSITLSLATSLPAEANALFFNNEPTLSFQFHPDKVDGGYVTFTPDQLITREDCALPGPSFLNLLLSRMMDGQPLDLSCSFTQIDSSRGEESGYYYVLSYFQVNYVNE